VRIVCAVFDFALVGMRECLAALAVLSLLQCCCSFLIEKPYTSSRRLGTPIHLVPLRNFNSEIGFLASEEQRGCISEDGHFEGEHGRYDLYLVDEDDLPDTASFVVNCFGAEAIHLSSDLGAFEKIMLKPAADILNGYSSIVVFAEVLAGTRSRTRSRLVHPTLNKPPIDDKNLSRSEKISIVEQDSIVLVLARERIGNEQENVSGKIEIIGSVELRLQPCDAKIPFSLPWLDRIERFLYGLFGRGQKHSRDLQPYLSNLCVLKKVQGKGIGKSLVRCVHNIASEKWGYDRIYLHVDPTNNSALKLYGQEGYQDVGFRWRPFWAGKAPEINYFVKKLK